MNKILILGGDGYLGWPTTMHLSSIGYDVTSIDNFSKRKIEIENSIRPLFRIETMQNRVRAWNRIAKKKIKFCYGDLLNHRFVYEIIRSIKPDAIIHYGEQPSAPYSMAGREQAVFTQNNNIIGTLNLLFAVKKYSPDSHIIKLGTMGVYGTPNIDIEEGFLKVKHKNRTDIMHFPFKPQSYYHLSKAHDSLNLSFACRVWGLKVTDLNQGVVYGTDTKETRISEELNTSFHYDHLFGTVINRFCVEAVCGKPLSVYGKGSQIRTFLNIEDTLKCISIAIKNPPKKAQYLVRNQFTEIFNIKELAILVQESSNKIGIKTNINFIQNPRHEMQNHYYNPQNKSFIKLGLKPKKINQKFIISVLEKINNYKERIDIGTIDPEIKWDQNH
jgi:UDP-sulfoquinovose synthase